jgi:hypothetical protein
MLFDLFYKIKRVNIFIILIACLCCCPAAKAQYFDLKHGHKQQVIPFKLIRNMIVIQLKINDKGPFNFILDTGVGLMIITEPNLVDSINLKSKTTIKIPGLGEGDDAEAYITSVLNVQIKGLISHDVIAAILKKDHFNLSNYIGMPIDGLLGYEFFNSLAVKVDFNDSTLTICRPTDLHHLRKSSKIPITVEARKPYLQALVTYSNGKCKDSKLVIDLGAGHPVSLENMVKNNGLPSKYILANLGVGLNGAINGYLSRINEIQLSKYTIKNVLASFPDSNNQPAGIVPRDGNLGLGLLKKFNVIFDYSDSAIYIRPNDYFNEPFEHDMSGLEYYADNGYKHIIISRVEPGSPGDIIGLEKGDEIVSINLKPVSKMSLEEIDSLFKSKDGRGILLEIFHDSKYDNVVLTLKRRI